MKMIRIILAFAIIFPLMSACKKDNNQAEKEPLILEVNEKTAALIVQNNAFGIQFFKEVATHETGNLMLSPLSASVALTMLLNGCQENTYLQIHEMLGYPENLSVDEVNQSYQNLVGQLLAADETISLALANAVFYRQNFVAKPPFLTAMQTSFNAHIEALNFADPQSIETINKWASDNTNAKITKVLEDIDNNAVMFLMNALYFKGDWTKKFDKANTSNQPFTLNDGIVVQAPTMNEADMKAIYISASNWEAVEIPYGRKNFSMVVILPSGQLTDFYDSFGSAEWQELTTTLDASTWSEVTVSLPKFKFDYEKFLNDELKQLGMTDAFMPGTANLSNISDGDLYVDFVKQNTFVEVNEEGTEAAAVTTVGINEVSMGPMLVVNRPFVFAIRERTSNTLLFIGAVSNPLE